MQPAAPVGTDDAADDRSPNEVDVHNVVRVREVLAECQAHAFARAGGRTVKRQSELRLRRGRQDEREEHDRERNASRHIPSVQPVRG